MRETNKEDLKQAYKSEKDPRIKIQILAVHMVPVVGNVLPDKFQVVRIPRGKY